MKPIWRGNLIFELLTIPIRLYAATGSRRVELRLLHANDHSPIRLERICVEEGRPVPPEEIVRGYDHDGEWVILEDEELDALAPLPTQTIEVREFVSETEIDPIYHRRPYYLTPDEEEPEGYLILREALRRSGRVGIVEFVLLRRQYLGLLRPYGGLIALETLYYPAELLDPKLLAPPASATLREGEIGMATELIERLTRREFELSDYRDEYRERLLGLIEERAAGRARVVPHPLPAPDPTPVIDLGDRLRESLERARDEDLGRAA